MNKRMTRIAAALTVLLFVSAVSIQAGGGPGMKQAPQKQSGAKHGTKPQPQPPKPQPQPQPQNNDSLSSNVIGTLRPSNPTQNAAIGTLRPSNPTQNAAIGTLRPSNPTLAGSDVIGEIPSVDSIVQQAQEAAKQIEPMIPQIQQQTQEAAKQIEPMIPQIRQQAQQAVQQIQNDPAFQQIVQSNPQQNDPIVIMPRSVQGGNNPGSSSGRRRSSNSHAYGDGYSGGNGQGPLIYNP